MKDPKNTTPSTINAMTSVLFHPSETPSESAINNINSPDVNRNAPIQSTPDARAVSPLSGSLGGSLGMTNIATMPIIPDAPAIT